MNEYTLKVKAEILGKHVHCRLSTGFEGNTFALIGTLIMTIWDWQHIGVALRYGCERVPGFVKLEMNDPIEESRDGKKEKAL